MTVGPRGPTVRGPICLEPYHRSTLQHDVKILQCHIFQKDDIFKGKVQLQATHSPLSFNKRIMNSIKFEKLLNYKSKYIHMLCFLFRNKSFEKIKFPYSSPQVGLTKEAWVVLIELEGFFHTIKLKFKSMHYALSP